MAEPNECGVYSEGLDEIQFLGKNARSIIWVVECDDGLWRYGLQADCHDVFDTWRGFSFSPSTKDTGYITRNGCLIAACEELLDRVRNDRDNPKASAEIIRWLETLSPTRQQLTLLDAMRQMYGE